MTKRSLSMMVLVLLLPLAAGAQQKGSIELKSLAEVEVVQTDAAGKKTVSRVDAATAKVVPGDIVIFTTEYRNIGSRPAENVAITNPVPEHVVYVDKSAGGRGARIDFSVDGGKGYAAAEKLVVTEAGKKRKAGAQDYTHIRWTLTKPVPPGGKGSVSFKAKIK